MKNEERKRKGPADEDNIVIDKTCGPNLKLTKSLVCKKDFASD
jgi:hypothetical protein